LLPVFLFLLFCGKALVLAQANTAEPVLTRIAEHLSLFEFDEAIALFNTISPSERESSNIKLLEASVLSSAGRYAEAMAIVQAISEKEPNNTEAIFVLATIEGAQGRNRQQREALERLINMEPDNTAARIALGNLHLSARSLRAAAVNYRHVITKEPENTDALLGMARLLRLNQEWDDAEVFFDMVVRLNPDMPEARSERARFYRIRGRLNEALADLNEAKRLLPMDYWIAIDRGNIFLDMGLKPQALAEFNRAVEINPQEFLAYVFTSGLKDDLDDLDGAERDYIVLTRLRPDYHYALEGLGLHRMRNGRWAEARETFLEAHRRAPDEYHYALLAGICWIRTGDLTGARAFLRQAQNIVTRDSLEWHMFRLYYDLTVRTFVGENDMVIRLDQEQDLELKARMMFYMAMYYDTRANNNLANRYLLLVSEMDRRAIPEWRLNRWLLAARGLQGF